MLNHTFTWNGHSSDEFGIKIERFRALNRSARKYDAASVPGRNGNIYSLQKAWEENLVSYQIFAKGSPINILDMTQSSSPITGTDQGYIINGTASGTMQMSLYDEVETKGLGCYQIHGIGTISGVSMKYIILTDQGGSYANGTVPADGLAVDVPHGYELIVNLQVSAGTYNNVLVPCFMSNRYEMDLDARWTDIMEWLNSADGYAELSDTYDTKHYREAVFVEATDIENSWNKIGRAVVSFRCRPERFLVGYDSITPSFVTVSTYKQAPLANPTNHRAKPIIKIGATTCSTSSPAWVEMSGCQIFVSQSFSDTLVIDSEKENAYFEQTGISANNIISAVPSTGNASDFMFIEPEQTVITKSNNMGSITLDARFWEI